jgi:two-component system, NtrC family, response regulator HupR/HoxA
MNSTSIIIISGFKGKDAIILNRCLSKHYQIISINEPAEVLSVLDSESIDLLLCNYATEEFDALNLLLQARKNHPETVRLLVGQLSHEEINKAINEAAIYQFLSNDWSINQLELLVNRALENKELGYRHRHLSRELKIAEDILNKIQVKEPSEASNTRFDKLVYGSPGMATLCNLARKAATTNLPVLIQGETGTGKELIARGIHQNSDRNDQPLLVHNCGGMSDELLHSELFGHKRGAFTGAISDRLGLFPAADGGTVFLDEIADVSPTFQVSLLRFLQEGEVKPLGSDQVIKCDVRIITACNRSLDELISKGLFRQDLFYRLNGFQLNIPPLRNRSKDIEVLANFLVAKFAAELNRKILGISPGVLEKFMLYHWPGNVRELENELKRMIAISDSGTFITEASLSAHIAALKTKVNSVDKDLNLNGQTLKQKVEEIEAKIIADTLVRQRWNQSKTAAELGLSRVGLANKIKRYELALEV